MRQSNIYPNSSISFAGVLQPLLEVLGRKSVQKDKLLGQEVVIHREDIGVIIALDSENNIHLLISTGKKEDKRLEKIELQGLSVDFREWAVAGLPAQNYLDLSCSTGSLPAFKRPFLRFAEDILYEISQSSSVPEEAIYRVLLKWKRFWSVETHPDINIEWLRGIFGELLFLNQLIKNLGPDVVYRWEGPLGSDHDFQAGTTIATEVKTSVSLPFEIHCNIRQLDPELFKNLYLVCYRLTRSDQGTSLPRLVKILEESFNDELLLDEFHKRLAAAGYQRQLEDQYSDYPLDATEEVVFRVNDSFPKIIEKSFISSPDHRISNIRYTLELSGIDQLGLQDIKEDLKSLKYNEGK